MSGYDKSITRKDPQPASLSPSQGETKNFTHDPFEPPKTSQERIERMTRDGLAGLEMKYVIDDELSKDAAAKLANEGSKLDQGKEPLDLLSTMWLLDVARVMAFGAKKYASHNWRKGLARSRLTAAALRHILAYNSGQDNDPETGLSHLSHASCCLMFLREQHETHPHLDDRYKGEKK